MSDPEVLPMDVHGVTHPGLVRSQNQDAFLVARLRKSQEVLYTSLPETDGLLPETEGSGGALLFLVADGVGGHDDGAAASRIAIEVIAEHIGTAASCYFGSVGDDEAAMIEQLEEAVARANARIFELHQEGGRGAATTVTLVLLIGVRAYVVHVGDSRFYQLNQNTLRQVTRDQTVVEALLDAGGISEEEAAQSKMGNLLTRAVGTEDARPVVGVVDLDPGDVLLLCSDGLTRHVDDATLESILSQDASAEAMCDQLLQGALGGGGRDNIAIIVGRYLDE